MTYRVPEIGFLGIPKKMGFLGEWIKVFSSFCAKFLAYLTGVFQNQMCSIITVKASNMQQKFAKNEEKPFNMPLKLISP